MHYIYVIQTREFITLKLPVYKIGKTEQELTSSGRNKRMSGYPKDSIQIALFAVSNCHEAEKLLIKNLKLSDDIKESKIGNEWFEGDIYTICQIALSVAMLFKTVQIEEEQPKIILSPLQCIYCTKLYTTNKILRKHLKTCKMKNNEIRKLEIETNMIPTQTTTICKYCSKNYSKSGNLGRHSKTCKLKDEYREHLETLVAKKSYFQRLSQ